MTISDGQATKKFDLYPLTQPQQDLSTFVWLDLGEEKEDLNTIAQLIMLHRKSFLKLQEEDSVIESILNNTCVVDKDVFDSSMLELITYEEYDQSCFLPKEPYISHQILTCELDVTPISKATMVNLTTTVELSKGHKLHVNSKLSAKQITQLIELPQNMK